MAKSRQLAAIMFTDIVGYTSLMGANEGKAFNLLRLNKQIQQPLVKKFNGRWIKELGDGVLTSFNSATDAAQCAILIQQTCKRTPELKLRIGIHLGEVLFENDDVFGDGVNIASRIQTIAPIGGIWISEAVYNNIYNKQDLVLHFVKEETLKNVKDPIRIYEIAVDQKIPLDYKPVSSTLPFANIVSDKSIAVLPFVNMSNDPNQEYFSDGMAEEIINSLAHLKDLRVAGRTSSFQFKNSKTDLREIGEKLGVSKVLEGSIRRQDDRIRITVQLINVENGYHLWSEKYDLNMGDIFSIEDEIALVITEKLKVTLLDKDRDTITKSFTQNPEAYELYLKGRFYLNRRGASIVVAIQYFQKAIDQDPSYSLPHVGYAEANLLMAAYGLAPPKLVCTKAKLSAERALELDQSLSEPYCLLGLYYTFFEWNWPEAKRHFLKSIELNPNYADVHFRYGWNYLSWVEGNFDEAQTQGELAIKLEPLSAVCHAAYALILHTAKKFSEALAICQYGIELDPNSFICRVNEGSIYLGLKEYTKAISAFKVAMEISNRHHFAVNGLIWSHCLSNNFDEAAKLMMELKERSIKEYIPNAFTAISAAHLNNVDEALDYLQKAFDDKDPIILTLKHETWVPDNLRFHRKYQEIIGKIGFP
jgi:adenylate cyclase